MNKVKRERIEKYSGKLRLLDGLVPHLKKNDIYIEKGQALTGDAPKVFLRYYEYGNALKKNPKKWQAYIAKVGHKWYPVESVMEQFLTDIGKLYGLNVADSKIALASGQLRFMSKYFLNDEDQLIHGAQIYAAYLNADISFVQEIEDLRLSSDFFTIKFTYEALKFIFPEHYRDLFE